MRRLPVRRPRPSTLLAVALSASLLAACGLPTTSPVEQGLAVGTPQAPPIQLDFEVPREGATPEQIVLGFLAAQWSSDDGYRAARAYLTSDASATWRPRSIVVYPGSARPATKVSNSGRTVTVSISEGATLDAQGRYSSSPVGTVREVEMTLRQVAGQWRIAALPDDFGLWLSQFYFDRAYRESQVAYVSATGSTLVPDWRRFQAGPGLSTSLARSLLDPVPEYLARAVRSGFASGTSLAVNAVPVTSGVAYIDLTSRALAMDASSRRAAWAQALRTMRQVPGASDVSLQVEGRPLDIGGSTSSPRTIADLGFEGAPDRSAVVLRRVGDGLMPVSSTSFPSQVDAPGVPGLPTVPASWARLGVSLDLRDVMGVSADGGRVARWIAGEQVPVTVPGSRITQPAFDRFGRPWLGGVAADGTPAIWTLAAAPASGKPASGVRRVQAGWLRGRELIDVRPSPEGARLLVLSKEPQGRYHLDLAGIIRDEQQTPVALDSAWPVGGDVAVASSAMWIDDHTLGVVGARVPSGEPAPLVVPLASATIEYPPITGLKSLVSLGGERGLVGVTTANEAVRRIGAAWQSVGSATDVIVPGR